MIPYAQHDVTEEDIDAVVNVLRSDFLTQGSQVPLFEKTVAEYCNANHSIAVNSATSALHISCLALGLGKGDWLWTSPITFVSSANCGLFCGARIDFVDIDPISYNLSPESLEEKLIDAQKAGCLPKVVIPVHLAGQSCDMRAIFALSIKFGFRIIEDASHAIGGSYKGEPIGNCKYSDITVFSFHPAKIITSGEGGMALTNNEVLAEKVRLLRGHGITRNQSKMTKNSDGSWYYQQIELGFNYRMSDIHAALGNSQMKRLDEYVSKRHEIAQYYNKNLAGLPIKIPAQNPDNYSSFHLYIIRLHGKPAWSRHYQLFHRLRASNIGVNVHYIPIFDHPYYKNIKCGSDLCESKRYYREAITLPLHCNLSLKNLDKIVSVLSRLFKELGCHS